MIKINDLYFISWRLLYCCFEKSVAAQLDMLRSAHPTFPNPVYRSEKLKADD